MPDLKVTLWSDSTPALWWIKEYGNWSVFVANRVKEIRQLTQIQSWKRFIVRRGRSRIIYCDNGTNFRGAFNDLAKLDWHKISRETSTQKIVWKFIPPTAAWWERPHRIHMGACYFSAYALAYLMGVKYMTGWASTSRTVGSKLKSVTQTEA
ncbi:DUF5641 domain-containing protein [Trichonephila clavipes]|nr:DUF5641 domain-containing protein [Trichonephila clavipes]